MTSRERTFRALARQPADRIPIDFWASAAMIRKIETALRLPYRAFLDRYDVDLRYIAGPAYIGPRLEHGMDIWGVPRVTVNVPVKDGTEIYQDVTEFPLAAAESVEQIEQYAHWPAPEWFDYSGIEAQCDEIRAEGRVAVFMGDRLNRVAQLKPAMYLRGVENILMDVAANPEIAHALFGRIKQFYLAYLERVLEAARGKIDIVVTGDDFGSQNGLLISPAMWRTYLRSGFAEYIALVKRHGCKAMHHTCGAVAELVPEFIECGLDILQSLQPEASGMALAHLKALAGARLSFQGGISVQQTLPFGTPEQIRQEVRRIADLFKHEGGYIFCTSHNIQADTPVSNVQALLEAYLRYGR